MAPEESAGPSGPTGDPSSHLLKFNDIGVGDEGPDGWVLATSSSAGFSVSLPGKYNDAQQFVKTLKGNALTVHQVGMQTPSGVTYTVIAFEGGDPKPKEEFLSEAVAKYAADWTVLKETALELDGEPGIHLELAMESSWVTMRAYATEGMFYMLVVESPPGHVESEADNIRRFFESFKPRTTM